MQCAALKYPVSESGQGLTLVLTHGLSSHKESYHPTIAHLLRLNAAGSRSANWIREIWSIDMPNHGESAALNRAHLEDRQERGRKEGWDGKCNTMDFSTYLNAFLSITQLQDHQVVGIAHSGSCTTHALTLLDRTHPHPFALVFIEPTLIFPDLPPTDPRIVHGTANVRGVLAKRDKWSNRGEAKRWLLGTTIWSKWDDQALDLFVPALSPAESTKSSSYVRSILRKEEESSLYACPQHTVEPAQLTRMCAALNPGRGRGPVGGVHILWAEVEDFIPKSARDEILDATSHRVLSHRVVSDAGHLIPQENPGGLADALYDVLVGHIAVAAGLTVRSPL
ncbi:Alpha/Beta hydrolase protein [Pisolithus sp. B1]|nr:Alpha/Beta hydrolase protein [Pisolithus sp. B1]